MSTSLPEPFDDITVDRRTADQRDAGRVAVDDHVRYHDHSPGPAARRDALDTLLERHTPSGGRRVRVRRDAEGRRQPVDAGELLVEVRPGTPLPAVARPFSRIAASAGYRMANADARAELDARLARYAAPRDDRDPDVDGVIARLRGEGHTARHHCLVVLQPRHQGPDVVVKLDTGPAPTAVENPSLYLSDRQRHPSRSVVVAVIDTGITAQDRHDDWLRNVTRNGNIDPLDAFPPPHGNDRLDFAAGHGSFVAGIVASIEPQADIRMYQAVDSDGFGREAAVAAAMLDAVADGAQVLSLSLGARPADGEPPLALKVAIDLINERFEHARDRRPVIVAAAGNFGDDVKAYPAGFEADVVSVAALTAEGAPCEWSSRGGWVTCSTIGEGIVAPYVTGEQDPAFGGGARFPAEGMRDSWAVWSGTSFAAPQIAAAVARTMREHSLGPRAALDHLLQQGDPIPDYGQAIGLLPGTPRTPR
jgi:hypothetical protein